MDPKLAPAESLDLAPDLVDRPHALVFRQHVRKHDKPVLFEELLGLGVTARCAQCERDCKPFTVQWHGLWCVAGHGRSEWQR